MRRKEVMNILLFFIGIFISAYIALLTIIIAMDYFGIPLLKNSGIYGNTILILICIIAAIVGSIIKYNTIFIPSIPHVEKVTPISATTEAILNIIEKYIKNNEPHAAIRLGRPLSRPLWIDGKYKERVKLGELLYYAASRLDNKEIQASVLIDDLGWTNVVLGNVKIAKRNIEHGIKMAKEIKDWYMVAKGYRHIGGICTEQSRFKEAEEYLLESMKYAEKITDDKKKKEMIAGIYYGLSKIALKSGNYKKAEEWIKKAQKLIEEIDDIERLVKTYSLLGEIYEKSNKYEDAIRLYGMGLQKSIEIHRIDEIAKNELGLARTYMKLGKLRYARRELERLLELPDIGESYKKDAEKMLNEIKSEVI